MVNLDPIDMIPYEMDIDDDMSDYERMRAQNLKELQSMLAELNGDINESVQAVTEFDKPKRKEKRWKKPSDDDTTFRYTGHIPYLHMSNERRKSARLSNCAPTYTYEDLPNEHSNKNTHQIEHDDLDNLEDVVYKKKRRFTQRRSNATICEIVPVDQITPAYLSKIASRTTIKVHCTNTGTSCHQCRQKTIDSKTYCRSGRCVGVRGQFCGVCLKNRYGEEAKDALLNPSWACPPCRGLCNCSICRTREGKRPTGILAPIAFRYGHKSVKDFLISLKGEGDYADDPPKKIILDDVRKFSCEDSGNCSHLLIGFSKDCKPIWQVRKTEFCFCDEDDDFVGFDAEFIPVMTRI